ncbi:MAG TPA: adenylate/guanylate cyclase domain-containing protein [Actinomycetes bacterium]|nr:adenylate/guanylate cyclase domain-containing protein [Actinomycetes bacterium]
MTCSHCAAEIRPSDRFCPECGTPVERLRYCPECGTPAERGRFCASCGAALDAAAVAEPARAQPVAERRVTSVLFGDLVGFTPLSETRDAEEVRELLSSYFSVCRTVIGRYGGTVEKFIGDAVMAVWGVPVAHEDDAERSVRAGLELVQAIAALGEDEGAPGLAMRVGVVTGEVAVTVGATGEGMVAGDAVNTAARVQAAAEAGKVWVDDRTRSLTFAAIAYADAGEHALKGKTEPLHLWQARAVVAELGGGQRVDGLEAPLTGRDRELRLLKELFHSTQESSRPRLVVVDGDPGVGKSRLVWEFEKYADGLTATVRWHRGRCLSYGDGVAFWALAEAVRTRLGLTEADAGEVVGRRLEEGLEQFVPQPDERDWLRPRLAALVGAGAGGFAREDLFAAWTAFFERLSQGGNAVVLVIDDAQYADDGLLDFLDHLLSSARAPVFVVALARPELLARRPTLGGRRATVLRLDPLDDAAMAALVDGLVVGLPAPARAALVERAEGVPLFAVETVRALIDRDAVVPRDGQYVPADDASFDLGAIGAPASLQALVAARLDALTPDERRVVADASVLGLTFTREGLAALGSDAVDLDAALDALQRKEIVAVQQDRFSAERGHFRFVQSVVRQVAYGTLSRRDRRTRHLAAADFLTAQPDPADDLAVVIAQHLLDAVDASGSDAADVPELLSRACALLERAGARAKALGSPAEARRLFEAALARTSDPADQARLMLAAAEAAQDAGDFRGSMDLARRSMEGFDALDRPFDAGIAAGTLCRSMSLVVGDFAGIVEIAEPRWQALWGVGGAERALLRLAGSLAGAHYELGGFDVARDFVQRRVFLAEAVGEPDLLANALIQLGSLYQATGAPVTSRAVTEAAARIARDGLPGTLANALTNVGTLLMSRDLPAALETFRESRDVARRSGNAGQLDYALGNYASALWTAGRLAESRRVLDEALETSTVPTITVYLALIGTWLADAFGEPLPDTESMDNSGSVWDLAALGCLRVAALSAAGEVAAAAALTEETLAHALTAGGLEDDFMHFWPPLVRAALAAGDVALAERLLEPVTSASGGVLSAAVGAHLLNLKGLVAAARGDDPADVETDLRAGLAALGAFGAVGWAARAEEDLARWLAAQGHEAEAASRVERARETYREIGALGWLARLDAWSLPLVRRP